MTPEPNPLDIDPRVTCFVAGTFIDVDAIHRIGACVIQRVRIGDMVWTPAGPCRVVANMAREVDALVRVTFLYGKRIRKLTCTPEHPFKVPQEPGWQRADALETGQELVPRDATTPALVLCVEPAGAGLVYNLTVAEQHCYYAGGVLVSNCHACGHFQRGRHCANRTAAGLTTYEIGPQLAALKQHCPGYAAPRKAQP